MGLLEDATSAAQLDAARRRAENLAHRAACEERDINYARRWWMTNIGAPAEFWLPKHWTAYGEVDGRPHAVIVTCDGWAFLFRPDYKPEHYMTARDCALVITGTGTYDTYKPRYGEYMIVDLPSLGRILTKITNEAPGVLAQIEALNAQGFGELMLEGKY